MPNLPKPPVKLRLLISILATVFILIIFSRQALADWTHDPAVPACSITFSGSGTITATAATTNPGAKITSLSKDSVAVTPTPTPPAASVAYTWTPTANSPFTATVQNANGNTNTCPRTYSCPAAGTCSSDCRTTATTVPDGACGTTSCPANAASFEGTCPATCHAADTTVQDASCNPTGKSCPANNQTAGSCSTTTCHDVQTYYTGSCNADGTNATATCASTIPAAGSCSTTTCHDVQTYYTGSCNADGTNATATCASTIPAAETVSVCRISAEDKYNGISCSRTHYDANCFTSCTGNTCNSPVVPTISPLTCVSTATYTTSISWTDSNITWVDISSAATDALRNANYSHKDASGILTTEAPTGFGTFAGTGVSSFTPGTTYYARVSNNSATNKNSSWVSFSRLACGIWSGWSGGTCSATCGGGTLTNETRTCDGPASGISACTRIDNTPTTTTARTETRSGVTSCNTQACPVNGGWTVNWSPCTAACRPGGLQYKYCNNPAPANGGAGCTENLGNGVTYSGSNAFRSCNTDIVCILPWIQVTGDVHSNTRINAPGGP